MNNIVEMKKLLIPFAFLVLVMSCTDNEEPQPAVCQPTTVEYFDETSTFFYFETGSNGFNVLSSISVDDGTDSAYQYTYEYTDNQLSKLTSIRDGSTVNFTPTFDGGKLTALTGRPAGAGVVTEEIQLSYSGDNVSRVDYFIADPNTETLYQFLHYAFTYNGGDLTSVSYNIDFVALLSLAFGQLPTAPYAPELVFTNSFEYGSEPAPNPLYRQYNLYQPESAMGANMPVNLIQRDADGNLQGSLGFTITFNEQGFPVLADTGNNFIDITYDCN